MVDYEVIVYTGKCVDATTFNNIFIKLVGTDGESKDTKLISTVHWILPFSKGEVSLEYGIPISMLVLVELNKQCGWLFIEDSWFPDKVEIKSPEGQTYIFPIYRWISDSKVHCFREGTVSHLCALLFSPRWDVYKDGLPHCMRAENALSLPCELQFSFTKATQFFYNICKNRTSAKKQKCTHTFLFPAYITKHWKADSLFGYQFLNGINPMIIQRCTALPSNFPVTDDMVFLHGRSLADEMKNGNIFLCDYKNLDGLQPNIVNGKEQYLMAPLVLLHKTPDDKLMPIAIQLKQTPADDNPIFVPTDSVYDWLLAKTFVRSADFSEHQLSSHLLRTHLLAEVFAVSLLRNIPMIHPLYKLLIPHTRYTLQINILARNLLISENGAFTTAMITILERALSSLTYKSLCIPDDIADCGLESVPSFYYRDDGLKLWEIIHSFVQEILEYYYKNDKEVLEDSELQNWVRIPQSFKTVADLVKFVTMVIFSCSAQHSAVNTGQYDYGGFMPNTPITLQLPPPTKKGVANEDTLLQTLPDINATVHGMATLWLLSRQFVNNVSLMYHQITLGQYPEEHFTEETPRKLIKVFQGKLLQLSANIKVRNESLEIPYTYMDPAVMENSVAI
uniref:Uncharacterized protein n=1 Tax=Anabas testudineus TaxID=64144 RepID=A0A3Q1INM4_ANATE